ncbi:MAG: polyprenyl synthetase family protein [Gaiellales bacterium]
MSLLAPSHVAFVERVERRLRAAVGALDGTVADAGGRTLESGGKRLRPLLVHLSAPPATRDGESLVIAGCAVELVHMATLVHDDQLDRAPLRRGRPTVWATDGELVATSTGDYLFARAFAELVETGDLPAVTLLSDACLSLARGEVLQRAQAGAVDTTVDQYLERCTLKTGRLFAAAAMLGGRLGGLGDTDLEALGRFAESLGLAFQIADDVLDCDGDPQTTGKPLGTDLLDGTVTLPLILAAERDPKVAEVIAAGARPGDVLPTLHRVVRSGAIALARVEAERHAAAAEAALDELEATIETTPLRAAVRSSVERSA